MNCTMQRKDLPIVLFGWLEVCVCVCVCVRERERDIEREVVRCKRETMYVFESERKVCVFVRDSVCLRYIYCEWVRV